jgi:hypothetical protein
MKTHPKFIELTPTFRKITTALGVALLVGLCSGCAPQTTGPSATGGPLLTAAIPNAREPITLVMSNSGQITNVTDANNAPIAKQNDNARQDGFTDGEKHYLFISGMTTDPSVPNQADCLIEDRQGQNISVGWCWPKDRSAWIRVNSGGIQDVHYVANDGSSQSAKPPVGSAAYPTPLREYWFGRRPQAPQLAAAAPLCVQKCFDGVCWCG